MDSLDKYLNNRILTVSDKKDVFHYSRNGNDIKDFNTYNDNVGIFDAIGVHTGSLPTIDYLFDGWGKRGDNGGVVYPLEIKMDKPLLNKDGTIKTESEMYSYLNELMSKIKESTGLEPWDFKIKQKVRDIIWREFNVIPYVNDVEAKGEISYISPAESINFKLTNTGSLPVKSKIKNPIQ